MHFERERTHLRALGHDLQVLSIQTHSLRHILRAKELVMNKSHGEKFSLRSSK
jgi:hypothetical protein